MLAAMLLVALFGSRGQIHETCPATPLEAIATNARVCDALEVTGRVDSTSVVLNPAFDVLVSPAALTRPTPAGPAVLTGYSGDGRTLFSVPFAADGPFQLDLALAPGLASTVARLTLTANGTTDERVATAAEVPSAEAITLDDGHVLFVWNAHAYPAVRIAYGRDELPIATLHGSQSFEQNTIDTRGRRFIVSFSNGVRSVDRTVDVLGR